MNKQGKETRCVPSFETWPLQETKTAAYLWVLPCVILPRSGNEEKQWADPNPKQTHLNALKWREAEVELFKEKKKTAWHENPALPQVPQVGHIPGYEAEWG